MIPNQYLKIKITNKGKNIAPVFCTSDKDLMLSANLIKEYELAALTRERKGVLTDRIRMIEAYCGDARLVRGICSLLDRKCLFGITSEQKKSSGVTNIPRVDSKILRRNLFEESARRGLALGIDKRNEILRSVASRMGLDHDSLQELIWNDLDENYRLQSFSSLEPADLAAWYNLAVVQTLLFSCNNLEFSVQGGTNWKRVLRDVKRNGLMYNIRSEKSSEHKNSSAERIFCSVDGPSSVLKMTEIYGMALAKLVPSILYSDDWSMQAWVVRKSQTLGKKVYDFRLTKSVAPRMSLPYRYSELSNTTGSGSEFDSGIEEKFATKFKQSQTGWILIREPDPIMLDDGKAFIPDFLFERHGHRIYLEIIGFWTLEYLKRKIDRLIRISAAQENVNRIFYDIFVAINKEYLTSSAYKDVQPELRRLKLLLRNDHLVLYEKGEVPLKQILSYLKLLNKDLDVRLADAISKDIVMEVNHLLGIDGDSDYAGKCLNGIISLSDLAARYNVPIETVHVALTNRKGAYQCLAESIGGGSWNYLIAGPYLIRKDKLTELQTYLIKVNTLNEASLILSKFAIPQFYHIDLLSELGYDVIWKGIDTNNATIERRQEKVPNSP